MLDRYGSDQALRPDVSRRRALVVAVFLCLWMVLVGARLAYLQTSQHEALSKRARQQQLDVEPLQAARGLILDRQGKELARSIDVGGALIVETPQGLRKFYSGEVTVRPAD